MNETQDVKELITALVSAQAKFKTAGFNRKNTYHGNKYADLTSCIESCREALFENGLCVMQYCKKVDGDFVLSTRLLHISGQWIEVHYPLSPAVTKSLKKNKNEPDIAETGQLLITSQSMGSAVTYAKRYALCALLCISADEFPDDDGNQILDIETHEALLDQHQIKELNDISRGIDSSTLAILTKSILELFNVANISKIKAKEFAALKIRYTNAKNYSDQLKRKAQEVKNEAA